MKDRSQEKAELMEKVFGKNATKRVLTFDDLQILQEKNNNINDDLTKMVEQTTKNNQQIDALLNQVDNIVDNTNNIVDLRNYDLENLRKQLIDDFGNEVIKEDVINVTFNQNELLDKFVEILQQLNNKIVRQQDYNASLCKGLRRAFAIGQQNSGLNCAMLISGNKNSGRHSSITLAASLLKEKQIINNDKIATIDMNKYQNKDDENNFIVDLYSAINSSLFIVFDNIENTSASYLSYMEQILLEGKLTLSKRYVLNNKQLVETGSSLVSNAINCLDFKGKFVFFISSLKQSKLLNVVGSRFIKGLSDSLVTNDLQATDIIDVFDSKIDDFKTRVLTHLNYQISFDDSFKEYLVAHYDASNCGYINKTLDNIYSALSEYKLNNTSDQLQEVNIRASQEIMFNDQPIEQYLDKQLDNSIEDIKAQLDELVGLKEVKDYIYSLQDFYRAQKIKQAQGMPVSEISKHMIFTGNPGTGKTTVARLLAKYLKAIGVLSNGQLIEVSRNNLVGKYAGHTAAQTMQVINSAMGGILFIDEAYSLYRGDNDSFGLECIDTLVKAMEDNREDLIVILAGYTKEMSTFLESNSGLKSRFPIQIEFKDYTGEELYQIAIINARSAGYKIDEKVKDKLISYFDKIQKAETYRSGNGRLARNVVEKAIMKQSTRLLNNKGQLDLLLEEDFDINLEGE